MKMLQHKQEINKMESLIRNIFLKYDSLPQAEKKKLLENLNAVLGDIPAKNIQKSKPAKGKYETVLGLTEKRDFDLYEKLRLWRNKVSRDLDIQPYHVFDNKTITNIAFYKPNSIEDLVKIYGVGPEKAGKYSEAVIELIKGSQPSVQKDLKVPKEKVKEQKITAEDIEVFEQPVIKRRLKSNK